MTEENNDIFLAVDEDLGYLGRSMHRKDFMTFIWGHPFSSCGFYDRFFYPSHIPPCAHMYAFRVPRFLRIISHRDLIPSLPF